MAKSATSFKPGNKAGMSTMSSGVNVNPENYPDVLREVRLTKEVTLPQIVERVEGVTTMALFLLDQMVQYAEVELADQVGRYVGLVVKGEKLAMAMKGGGVGRASKIGSGHDPEQVDAYLEKVARAASYGLVKVKLAKNSTFIEDRPMRLTKMTDEGLMVVEPEARITVRAMVNKKGQAEPWLNGVHRLMNETLNALDELARARVYRDGMNRPEEESPVNRYRKDVNERN